MSSADLKKTFKSSLTPCVAIIIVALAFALCTRLLFNTLQEHGVHFFIQVDNTSAPLIGQLSQIFAGTSIVAVLCACSIIGGMLIALLTVSGMQLAKAAEQNESEPFAPHFIVGIVWSLIFLVILVALAAYVMLGTVPDIRPHAFSEGLSGESGLMFPLIPLMLWTALLMQISLVYASVALASAYRKKSLVFAIAIIASCLVVGIASLYFDAQIIMIISAVSPNYPALNSTMGLSAVVNLIVVIFGCIIAAIALKQKGNHGPTEPAQEKEELL